MSNMVELFNKAKVLLVAPSAWVFGGGGLALCAASVLPLCGGDPFSALVLFGTGAICTCSTIKNIPLYEMDYEDKIHDRKTERVRKAALGRGQVEPPVT